MFNSIDFSLPQALGFAPTLPPPLHRKSCRRPCRPTTPFPEPSKRRHMRVYCSLHKTFDVTCLFVHTGADVTWRLMCCLQAKLRKSARIWGTCARTRGFEGPTSIISSLQYNMAGCSFDSAEDCKRTRTGSRHRHRGRHREHSRRVIHERRQQLNNVDTNTL